MSLRQVLFLDDCSERSHWACANLGPMDAFLSVSTVAELIDVLEGPPGWDELYLDHDLDPGIVRKHNPRCGCNADHWISKNRPPIGKIICHSMDEVSGNRMAARLRRAGYDAQYISFMRLVDEANRRAKSPAFFT